MKVLHFGAGGHIGSAVAKELLERGHTVTGVGRSTSVETIDDPRYTAVRASASDPAVVSELIADHDAVASTIGPRIGTENDHEVIVGTTRSLIDAVRRSARTRRLVVLGGAGSLRVSDGSLVHDDPHFPKAWLENARAQAAALELYREVDDVDWTFISPAAEIADGDRTGTYRTGGDQLLVDEQGRSRISIADYAIAFVDEVESGAHPRQRITVAQ